jgi:hypothetical protein
MLPIQINNLQCKLHYPDAVQRFRVLAQHLDSSLMPDALVDCDTKDLASSAVSEVLAAPAMDGKHAYVAAFDDTPSDLTAL